MPNSSWPAFSQHVLKLVGVISLGVRSQDSAIWRFTVVGKIKEINAFGETICKGNSNTTWTYSTEALVSVVCRQLIGPAIAIPVFFYIRNAPRKVSIETPGPGLVADQIINQFIEILWPGRPSGSLHFLILTSFLHPNR